MANWIALLLITDHVLDSYTNSERFRDILMTQVMRLFTSLEARDTASKNPDRVNQP